MAYKCPAVAGAHTTLYYSAATGMEYGTGQNLPAISAYDKLYVYITEGLDHNLGTFFYTYDRLKGYWTYGYDFFTDYPVDLGYAGLPILTSINGKPVKSLNDGYGLFTKTNSFGYLQSGVLTIPSGIIDIAYFLKNQSQYSGLIIVNCNPTTYTDWLQGTAGAIKLGGSSSMLSELASGYPNVSMYVAPTMSIAAERLASDPQKIQISAAVTGDTATGTAQTTYTAKYRLDSAAAVTLGTYTLTSASATKTYTISTNDTMGHAIEFIIEDNWGGKISSMIDVPVEFKSMTFGAGGKSIGFGRAAAEENVPPNGRVDCAMDCYFDSLVANNIVAGGHPSGLVVQGHTTTISAASNSYGSSTFNISKQGYFPIGIVGHNVSNGSGSGGTYAAFYKLFLSSESADSATVTWGLRANGGAVNNCTLEVKVLWAKLCDALS